MRASPAGNLAEAAELIDEDRSIGHATCNPPVAYCEMLLAAAEGSETDATELIEATIREATARGQGRLVGFAEYATALLYNGLGRYEATARDAAGRAFGRDILGLGTLVAPELAEAASRTDDPATCAVALRLDLGTSTRRADRLGARDRGPHARPASTRATTPKPRTASRSNGWEPLGWASTVPALSCCTANGCAEPVAASTNASSCAQPTTSS